MTIAFIMHEVHAYPSLNDFSKSCLCAWQLLFHVLMSPRAIVSDPSKGLQNDFLAAPEKSSQVLIPT